MNVTFIFVDEAPGLLEETEVRGASLGQENNREEARGNSCSSQIILLCESI